MTSMSSIYCRRYPSPTLVLHCRHDTTAPFDEGRRIATSIPNAKFVTLDSENHTPPGRARVAEISGGDREFPFGQLKSSRAESKVRKGSFASFRARSRHSRSTQRTEHTQK